MMIGVSVAVLSAEHISLYGVALCLGASFSGALRWVLMHYFMRMHMEGHQVMAILYKISPVAFISLFPVALFIEGHSFLQSPFIAGYGGLLHIPVLLLSLFGGLLASVLIFVEMILLAATSSLTFTVLGQVKEIIQIILSMVVFNDNLTTRSICGIIFSLIAANNYRKIKMEEMHHLAKGGDKIDAEEGDDDVEQLLPKQSAIRDKVTHDSGLAIMQLCSSFGVILPYRAVLYSV
jgi:threonine/homoserine efflux transporter RhtA